MKFLNYITKHKFSMIDCWGICTLGLFLGREQYWYAFVCLLVTPFISALLTEFSDNKPKN